MKRSSLRERERGTQIVEMAVALPLLLFLVLVVSEGAGMIRAHQVLNNAAREGARLSIMLENKDPDPTDNDTTVTDAIKDQVVAYAQANGLVASRGVNLTTADVTINQCVQQPTPGGAIWFASRVVVQTNYQLRYLPRLPWFNVPNGVPIAGRAEFVNFYGC